MSLVTRTICLRTAGILLEPLLEVGLGAVDLGGVEEPDAAGEGEPEDAIRRSARIAPCSSMRDLDAGLAQLPLRERAAAWRQPPAPASRGRRIASRPSRSRAGLEERAAIGAVQIGRAHHTRLLVGKVRDEEFTTVAQRRSRPGSTLALTTTRPQNAGVSLTSRQTTEQRRGSGRREDRVRLTVNGHKNCSQASGVAKHDFFNFGSPPANSQDNAGGIA